MAKDDVFKYFNESFYASHFAAKVLTSYIYGLSPISNTTWLAIRSAVKSIKEDAKKQKIVVQGETLSELDTFEWLMQIALSDVARDYVKLCEEEEDE